MEIQQQFADDVQFIGVPEPNGNPEPAREFVAGTGSEDVVHIHDVDGDIWSAFEVSRRQTYIIVSADGTSRRVEFENLASAVAELAAA